MPRPRKTRNDRRTGTVAVRLLPRQRRKVKREARAAGVTVSAYLTTLIDNRPLRTSSAEPPPDLVPYPLLAQWQRAGNNINQLARAAHRGRTVEADWMLGAMRELLTLMIDDQITRRFAMRYGAALLAERFATAG
jgi:hypothetical protein